MTALELFHAVKSANKALHRTAFPLRSIAAGELGRCFPAESYIWVKIDQCVKTRNLATPVWVTSTLGTTDGNRIDKSADTETRIVLSPPLT